MRTTEENKRMAYFGLVRIGTHMGKIIFSQSSFEV